MSSPKGPIPIESQSTAEIIDKAHRDFAQLIVLPWLLGFTIRIIKAAKEEERQAILTALRQPAEVPEADPLWYQGHNSALEKVRAAILDRCDHGI